MIEQSDTTNPQSLRGVGPYDPSGFRLVERAYSSERPEAKIKNPKLLLKADLNAIKASHRYRTPIALSILILCFPKDLV
jgi:hypothetical protein